MVKKNPSWGRGGGADGGRRREISRSCIFFRHPPLTNLNEQGQPRPEGIMNDDFFPPGPLHPVPVDSSHYEVHQETNNGSVGKNIH